MLADAVMITQAVDEEDPVLGFTPGWVNALAQNFRKLSVFCLRVGRCTLRENVSLRTLGEGRAKRLRRLREGLKGDLETMELAAILAHMCPRYAVAARGTVGPEVPIVLWYAHSAKSVWLRMAHRVSRVVFTPTVESCPIRSPKVRVVGHGIDMEKFSPAFRKKSDGLVLLSAGRITPLKRYDFLLDAFAEAARALPARTLMLRVVGSPSLPGDARYLSRLKSSVREKGLEELVEFRPAVPYSRIETEYAECDVFVNTAFRHSIDKAPLEAMACGKVLVTSNRNFRPLLGEHAERLVADDEHPDDLAKKLVNVAGMPPSERQALGLRLREIVARDHDLTGLMKKIVEAVAGPEKG